MTIKGQNFGMRTELATEGTWKLERCWEVEVTRKSQGIRDRDMLGWCGGFKTGLQILRHVKRWSLIPLH